MELLIVGAAAFFIAWLTLFSGFGLGTILMPVLAVFFPVSVAIALTAVVHLLNNIFKFFLLGKFSDWAVVFRFGFPAMVAAWFGAWILVKLGTIAPFVTYQIGEKHFSITFLKVLVALIMVAFALLELLPRFKKLNFERKYLSLGGILSGFLGGLSGNQGALRSAFLINAGLNKEAFLGTGIVIACLVDISRLVVYGQHWQVLNWRGGGLTLVVTTVSAFMGSFLGNQLAKKTTIHFVQLAVAVMLFVIAGLLGVGII